MTQARRPNGSRNHSKRGQKHPVGYSVRHEALQVLDAILINKRPFEEVWSQSLGRADLKEMTDPDRGFTRLIVIATLRHMPRIDQILSRFLKNPLPDTAQTAQNILRSAIAQLLVLKSPPHAVLNIATSLAASNRQTLRYKGLINGVLRSYTRSQSGNFAVSPGECLNSPPWLYERWKDQYGEDRANLITAAHLVEPALDITVKSDRKKWAKQLKATLLPSGSLRIAQAGNPVNLDGFSEGSWWVQDAAAALPAKLFGDIDGKNVLDLCAAPGGKTAQLIAAGAKVTAVDRSKNRMKRLTENLSRLNLEADLITADAASFKPENAPDAILLDAPCSATGTIRRHPDVQYLKTLKDITDLAEVQTRLIAHAADILKPKGTLIYCVCSLEREEGEDQITEFLKKNKEFSLDLIKPEEIPGLEIACQERGDVRTLPYYYSEFGLGMQGMDGFYIARLVKS